MAVLLSSAVAAVGAFAVAGTAVADGSQPHGANGSVKVDGSPFDNGPSNEPHLDQCVFAVQLFGFDEGENSVDVTFEGWPPSGTKTPVEPVQGRSAFDFEGGRPPGNTLNHQELYRLDTEGLVANKKGEVHVKLTVTVTDAGGKVDFDKHKVFWVPRCLGTTPTPTPTPTTTPTPTPTTTPTPKPTGTPTPTPKPTPTWTPTGPPTPNPGPTAYEGGA